jgi:hypothetical protein
MERTVAALPDRTDRRRGEFSRALRIGLVVPAIFWCVAAVLAGFVFAPRSLEQAIALAVMLGAGLLELVLVPIAVTRLVQNSTSRTRANFVATALGLICLMPELAVYVYIVMTG